MKYLAALLVTLMTIVLMGLPAHADNENPNTWSTIPVSKAVKKMGCDSAKACVVNGKTYRITANRSVDSVVDRMVTGHFVARGDLLVIPKDKSLEDANYARSLVGGEVVSVAAPVAMKVDIPSFYDYTAKWTAYELGCKGFRQNPDGPTYLDSGVCYLKGHRVNVVTFEGPRQQAAWNNLLDRYFGPKFFWASGKGAVVVAKNGNLPAARQGAIALRGHLLNG